MSQEVNKLVDHLFRHEAGKMVAVLTRVFGFSNIEQAEDIVHDTMVKALDIWKYGDIPANPQAWLYRTAKNQAIDIIRRQKVKYRIEGELSVLLKSEYTLAPVMNEMFTEGEIKDSQLRMMFACCHPAISQEAQITLMLKTLCGLSVREIGNAFLTNEETIQKRLYRTKEKIRSENISLNYPVAAEMPNRLDAVLKALYLLFNEGYSSSHPEKLIREDLCEEAMRLNIMLTENNKTDLPSTNAVLALMCYQVSRFNTRLDDKGFIILLKDQDRSHWNKFLINKGNEYMNRSSSGDEMTDYHIEAAIASVHANATSYESTNWKLILSMYDTLLARTGSPMVALNRCLVLGEVEGPQRAIEELQKMTSNSKQTQNIASLQNNSYYNTSLGEMYLKQGNKPEAKKYFSKALKQTLSKPEAELINRKMNLC